MTRERTCQGCGGTGWSCTNGHPYEPEYRGGLSQCALCGAESDETAFCPACDGTGRVEEHIPASDALADAETLRSLLTYWYPARFAARQDYDLLYHAAWAVGRSLRFDGDPDDAREGFRAAFAAVPGLRGE